MSRDELTRWYERGWLSFKPEEKATYDNTKQGEIWFVQEIARCGLCDEWVGEFLAGLTKPYCYDSATTFYCFTMGTWVTLRSPKEDLDDYMATLAEDGAWDTLRSIRDTISDLLEREPDQVAG